MVRPVEDRMIRTIGRLVRDPDEAEDAMQEALARIWRNRRNVSRHPNPQALVLRICASAAYDALRRRSRYEKRVGAGPLPAGAADATPPVSARLEAEEDRVEVMKAIGSLPRNQAAAILLRLVHGLPYEEVAQALGCREATARKHVSRGRLRLQELLAHLDPFPARESAR